MNHPEPLTALALVCTLAPSVAGNAIGLCLAGAALVTIRTRLPGRARVPGQRDRSGDRTVTAARTVQGLVEAAVQRYLPQISGRP